MGDKGLSGRGIFLAGLIVIVALAALVVANHDVLLSIGGASTTIREDSSAYRINVSLNNTDALWVSNITQVNITIPETFTLVGENGSDAGNFVYTNTSTVLSWTNSTPGLVMNLTLNYFWFNISASTPGMYNISVRSVNISGVYESNISITVNDTTVPTPITFVSPTTAPSGGNISIKYIAYNSTSADNVGLENIVVRLLNATYVVINSSNSSVSPFSGGFNITGLADGRYYLNATANDSAGNINISVLWALDVDTVSPQITFNNTVAADGLNISQTWILLDSNITEGNLSNVTFRLHNTTGLVNLTTFTAATWILNVTGLPNGRYTYNITARDYAGNVNTTSTRTITLDGYGASSMEFTAPTPYSPRVSGENMSVNLSVTDAWSGVKNITLRLYNSTHVMINSSYFNETAYNWTFINLTAGVYFINATMYDYVGNLNNTETRNITVDTQIPVVELFTPVNNTNSTDSSITFTCNVTDDVGVSGATLYLWDSDGGLGVMLTDVLSGGTAEVASITTTITVAGTYSWNCYANDSANNRIFNESNYSYIRDSAAAAATTTTGSGGSGGAVSAWKTTYNSADEELSQKGEIARTLLAKERVQVKVGGSTHNVGVLSLTSTTATVEISSTPQQATLNVGETKKFEITGDNYYDLGVRLVSIVGSKASLSIIPLNELKEAAGAPTDNSVVPATDSNAGAPSELSSGNAEPIKEASNAGIWILVAVVVIVVLAFGWYFLRSKSKKDIRSKVKIKDSMRR